MKKSRLQRTLEALQKTPLNEFMGTGTPAGAAMDQRPDASGLRGKGAKFNFVPRDDSGEGWPYEDDGYMMYGRSMGNKGRDRGDRPGEHMGAPLTPRYQSTWESGPGMDESPDYDESQRHGHDKYRNVWKDTPDGREWTKLNNESMGAPFVNSPGNKLVSMDGPQHNVLHFSSNEEDMLPKKDNRGAANMYGGPGTIPGQGSSGRGWSSSPTFGDNPNDVWKPPQKEENDMKLQEFFDPEPIQAEKIDNPKQDYLKDQSDGDIENKVGQIYGDEDDNDDFSEELPSLQDLGIEPGDGFHPEDDDGFTDRLGSTTISLVPNAGFGGEFVSSPDKMGGARGTYGLHSDSKGSDDLVDKRSAWDVIELIVQNIKKSEEDL